MKHYNLCNGVRNFLCLKFEAGPAWMIDKQTNCSLTLAGPAYANEWPSSQLRLRWISTKYVQPSRCPSGLGHEMAPGGPQKDDFKRIWFLAAKSTQEDIRIFILRFSGFFTKIPRDHQKLIWVLLFVEAPQLRFTSVLICINRSSSHWLFTATHRGSGLILLLLILLILSLLTLITTIILLT